MTVLLLGMCARRGAARRGAARRGVAMRVARAGVFVA
jgi:hypothetical protein